MIHYSQVDWHIFINQGAIYYYSKEPVLYDAHEGSPIILPAYYLHDGGSIPWLFTVWIKRNSQYLTAFALHDYTYTADFPHVLNRKQSDKLLWEYCLLATPENTLKPRAIYGGVKLGGWKSYKKNNAKFYKIKKQNEKN